MDMMIATKHPIEANRRTATSQLSRKHLFAVATLFVSLLYPVPPALAKGEPIHTVQPGDTLYSIAIRHGVSLTAMVNANHIVDQNLIWVGQSLSIPQVLEGAAAPETNRQAQEISVPIHRPQTSSLLRRSVADFLEKPFIQASHDGMVFYSYTPVPTGQRRLHWFQETRNHGHENLASLAYASLGRCNEAQGMLQAFFHNQNDDGGYPYIVTPGSGPGNVTHGNVTLPVLAWQSWQIYQQCGDGQFLREALESGARNDDWWWMRSNRRDFERCQGMFYWNEIWETVRDDANLPTWTATGGPQHQCAVDLNAYLVANDRALSNIARHLGDPRAELFRAREMELAGLMNDLMWDNNDNFFYGISRLGGLVSVKDIGGLLTLYAHVPNASQAAAMVRDHLGPDGGFHTSFGLPSLSRFEPGYGSANRWKGGMWPSLTMLVVKGLADYGYLDHAQRIVSPLVRSVTTDADRYWEFYDSQSGLPSHAQNYIWAATVLPMAEFAQMPND